MGIPWDIPFHSESHLLSPVSGDLLLWIDGRPSTEMSPEELAAELPLGIFN